MERYKLLPPLPPETRGPPLPQTRDPRKHRPSTSEPSGSIPLDVKDSRKRTPVPPQKAHVKSNSDSSVGGLSGEAHSKQGKRSGHWCRSNVSSSTTLVNGGVTNSGTIPDIPQQNRTRSQSQSCRRKNTLPEPEIDRAVGRKSVPASTMEAPIEELDSGVRCSTAAELQGLWETANGRRPKNGLKRFNMRFSRTGPSTFTLGDPQQPFYTTHTQGKKLSMTRTNPSNPQRTTSIMDLQLENRHRHGPNDGLVTFLFSRLAALLAIEQAGEYATRQRLDSRAALEVEANALRHAAEQESYRLNWNNDGRLYGLQHASCPGTAAAIQPQALIGAMGIPLSPIQQRHLSTSTLHITISTPSSSPSSSSSSTTTTKVKQPPTIIVTTPTPLNATETASQAATPRTSTLPHPAADDTLASLDLGTMVFTVDTDAIMATAPSLYAVDSVVAAVLAVAAVDGQTRGVLDGLKVYNPGYYPGREDTLTPFDVVFRGISRSTSDGTARDTATTGTDTPGRDAATDTNTDTSTGIGTSKWTRLTRPLHNKALKAKPKKQPSHRQILIDEFSPVHHGRYGPGSSREGQYLPRPTVRVIHGLYWALEVVVRGLTVVVRGVGRVVVEVTRGVTFLGRGGRVRTCSRTPGG